MDSLGRSFATSWKVYVTFSYLSDKDMVMKRDVRKLPLFSTFIISERGITMLPLFFKADIVRFFDIAYALTFQQDFSEERNVRVESDNMNLPTNPPLPETLALFPSQQAIPSKINIFSSIIFIYIILLKEICLKLKNTVIKLKTHLRFNCQECIFSVKIKQQAFHTFFHISDDRSFRTLFKADFSLLALMWATFLPRTPQTSGSVVL
jgi:hypothetical protein